MENLTVQNNSIENKSFTFQAQCPHCAKMYMVNAEEIISETPEFGCVSCGQHFWLAYPLCLKEEPAIGKISLEMALKIINAKSQKALSCPRCHATYYLSDKECSRCGIVFEKWQQVQSAEQVDASTQLKKAWEFVLANYDFVENHQKWVHECQRENNLSFALQKYNSILNAHSGDEIANKMKGQIVNLMFVQTPAESVVKAKKKSVSRAQRLGYIIFLLCGIVIAVGMLVPTLRNLVGVGVSLLFLAITIKFYLNQN